MAETDPQIPDSNGLEPLPPVNMVYKAASASSPGQFHFVVVCHDGTVDCTCTGWRIQKKCWHVTKAKALHGLDEEEFSVSI